jgi:hypothetical protein
VCGGEWLIAADAGGWQVVAVDAGGRDEGHTIFRRCAAPEKIKKYPFGKLRINSQKATTGSCALIFWAAKSTKNTDVKIIIFFFSPSPQRGRAVVY